MNGKSLFDGQMQRSLIVLFGLALVIHFLDSRGYLHGTQMALGLDPMLQVNASATPTKIGIVKITEEDYRKYFCGQSPLDGRGVIALVQAVREKLHPEVIGVDLDTSDWKPGAIPAPCMKIDVLPCTHKANKGENVADQECMAKDVDDLVSKNRGRRLDEILENAAALAETGHPKPHPTRIVWAQVPGPAKPAAPPSEWWAPIVSGLKLFWSGEREESTALPLQPVAGRILYADSVASGIPSLPLDSDGVVRKYRRRFRVIELSGEPYASKLPEPKEMNSLPHALASACGLCIAGNRAWQDEEALHSSKDLILKFSTDERVFNPTEAKYLLPPLPGDYIERPSQMQIDRVLVARPLQIVLIGGTYKGARDIYRTPLGEVPGVQLLAQAVETDLHQGISEMNEFGKFSADIFAGLIVIFLWRSKTISRYISLWVIFLMSLSVIVSLCLFRQGVWLDSIAILVGVVIHQVSEEFQDREEKIKKYKTEIGERDSTIEELKKSLKACTPEPVAPSPSPVPVIKSAKSDG